MTQEEKPTTQDKPRQPQAAKPVEEASRNPPRPSGHEGSESPVHGEKTKGGAGQTAAPCRWECAHKLGETVYHLVLILVGLVGLFYGVPIIQAQHAKAQLDETVAKAEIARREAKDKKVLDLDISAVLLGEPGQDTYVLITLEMRNTGNVSLSVPAKNIQGHISRIGNIEPDGRVRFQETYPFRFGDLPDRTLSQMDISPGEKAKLQAVQKLQNRGLHLIAIAINLDEGHAANQAFHSTLISYLN